MQYKIERLSQLKQRHEIYLKSLPKDSFGALSEQQILARLLLSELCGLKASPEFFERTVNQTWYLDDLNLYWSIAYTGDWVLVATNTTKIGVDVEKIKPRHSSLLKEFKSKNWWHFYQQWTTFEAFYKVGKGPVSKKKCLDDFWFFRNDCYVYKIVWY